MKGIKFRGKIINCPRYGYKGESDQIDIFKGEYARAMAVALDKKMTDEYKRIKAVEK